MSKFVRNHPEIIDGKMSPEVLWAIGDIEEFDITKDGQSIVYPVKYHNIAENKGVNQFYTVKSNGSDTKMITNNDNNKSSPKFLNNGKIAFLQTDPNTKTTQIHQMDADGSNVEMLSNVKEGIDDFLFSPDNTKVIYVSNVKNIPPVQETYPDLPAASGLVATDIMYLHWDHWKSTVPHPFVADYDGRQITYPNDILNGTKFECPREPFNTVSDLCWSPDSTKIVYVMKPSIGKEYSFKTRTDLFVYDVKTQWSDNLTPTGDHGYIDSPVFSPDGKKVAVGRMQLDGYESDVTELYVYDFEKKTFSHINPNFKDNANEYAWSPDSSAVYFVGLWHGHHSIYKQLLSGELEQITTTQYDYTKLVENNGRLYTLKHSLTYPHEIVSIDARTKALFQLTFENKDIIGKVNFGKIEERWTKSVDGKDIHSYVTYPPGFDPTKKYPAILFCTGGPQMAVANIWRRRWNLSLMASQGFIVVAPNRRGTIGFGFDWRYEVSKNFGGHAIDDLLSVIDDVSSEEYVNSDKIGCVGMSYGGFSCFYLESHHEKRFKCFVAHDGLFNFTQTYLETEEMFFVHHDIGAPWDKETDPAVKKSYEYSPELYVDKWDTPILVIHGVKDYRLHPSQGIQAFNAARIKGIPAKLLLFPDENHWVLKVQNAILWDRTIFDWLKQWLC